MEELRTARSFGVEPDVFWGVARKPGQGWSERSRLLAWALLQLEEQTGPEGFPLLDELDPDNDGWFEAHPIINQASAARERWYKDHEKVDPGTRIVVRYTRTESTEGADGE